MKRLFDISFAVVLLVVASPLLLIAALAVMATSPGGVLFHAKRVGKGGVPYIMYKLRTMTSGAEKGAPVTLRGDSRITPVGKLLRISKLDELPQLFNVLNGDMSVVGPRPEDPCLVEKYYDARMRQTLDYKPGLTSPGTILYIRELSKMLPDTNDMDTYARLVLMPKLEHELSYFPNQSLVGDIAIITKTGLSILAAVAQRITRRRADHGGI